MSALLVDVGNSRIKWRTTASDNASSSIATADIDLLATHFASLRDRSLARVFVSCVAGAEVEAAVIRAALSAWPWIEPRPVRPVAEECGVVNGYDDPAQLGPDRWAAMIGAHAGWARQPLLVCSFGTATTVDLLVPLGDDADRASFAGGYILPGFEAMRRSLATGTARLGVGPGHVVDFALRTEDAVSSGIMAAQVGAIAMGVAAAAARLAAAKIDLPLACIVAGGDAERIVSSGLLETMAPGSPVHVAPDLVLQGLRVIASQWSIVSAPSAPASGT